MHIEEVVQGLSDAEQSLTERGSDAVHAVENLQARGIAQLVQYRQVLPTLEHSRTNKADVRLDQRTRERNADSPDSLRRARTTHEIPDESLHSRKRTPLIASINVHLASAEDVSNQIDQ